MGVTFDSWLGVIDFHGHRVGQPHLDRLAIPQGHRALHVLEEEVFDVADDLVRDRQLFIALLIHKHETVGVGVQELHVRVRDVRSFDLFTAAQRLFQGRTDHQIDDAQFVKGVAFAWLHEIHFKYQPGVVVENQACALVNFTDINGTHGMPPLTLQSDEHAAQAALDRTVTGSLPVGNEGGTVAVDLPQASAQTASRDGGAALSWQAQLADAIRDVDELWCVLALPAEALPAARAAAGSFRLLVPRGFAALMRAGDLADPLLRQVVPLGDELCEFPGFTVDPLAESACTPTAGLLHKYHGRALLVTTGACAVHCRYCFRRHYPYEDLPRGRRWWGPAIDYLNQHADVSEILLSGGDPLTLPDAQLAVLAQDLASIPHLKRLRIHTRLPIVLPARVTDELIAWFASGRLTPVMVVHVNHPRELSAEVVVACRRLRDAGVTMLSQAVLLAGVNDEASVLCVLSEALFSAGIVPYYLHQLDSVQGAGHFQVSDERAIALMQGLAARLPGYLVPRLVREIPNSPGKTPIRW